MTRNRLLAALAIVAAVALGRLAVSDDPDPDPDAVPRDATSTTVGGATSSSAASPDAASASALRQATDPSGPDDLAKAIEAAEVAIRDPATPEAQLPGWARAQQVAYRRLARTPDWDAAVAANLEGGLVGELADVAAANADTFRELWSLTDPRDALPDWVIVAPPPAGELLGYYRAAEAEFGVEWEYLAAIHLVETRMGRIRGASSAGARGPMQFIPSTWDAYGEGDIEDASDSIRAAARYLVAAGAPGNMPKALFAYNHSDHYVSAVTTYAEIMRDDERAYLGYYHWDVYYRLKTGDVVLPVGWTGGTDG